MSDLATQDREARKVWKTAFFAAYHAIGTNNQTSAVQELKKASTVYFTINQKAIAAGVDYDPRKEK